LLLVFIFTQMHNYADIINDAGIVRGGTQRIIKLEENQISNEEFINEVDNILINLIKNEDKRIYKSPLTKKFQQDLYTVNNYWQQIKIEIDSVRLGNDTTTLLNLSEKHFAWSNKAVTVAEIRAEKEFKDTVIISLLLILLTSALMVFFEWRSNRQIKKVFYTDFLTGLSNSIFFENQVEHANQNAASGTFVLVYLNVNNFKFINESYGYDAGDTLLTDIANAIKNYCIKDEICARINADRFGLLLYNKENAIQDLQQSIHNTIFSENSLNLSDIFTCSYGAYILTNPFESGKSIISKANRALKEGKPKDRIAFYDEYLMAKINKETLLTQHMRLAIKNDEFQIFLQAKTDLNSEKLCGAEVLCRWISKQFGYLPPDDFIPLFEKNGFIVTLDFHMLEKVCQGFNEELKNNKGEILPLSINFSRITLLQDNFISRFCNIIEKYKIPPKYIEVEITESAFIMNEGGIIQMLCKLQAKGFKIVMDDFGLGYSSLNLLRKLPINILKIDKEFLKEGTTTQRTFTIIKHIVEMSKDLDIEIVCEGVETKEHITLLKSIGCPIVQGYYYSKPLPIDKFREKYHINPREK
ncbi:MAG: bifunctional diguanylate cyclase/phosphodiesterase, partial [Clostridiales bacterium]